MEKFLKMCAATFFLAAMLVGFIACSNGSVDHKKLNSMLNTSLTMNTTDAKLIYQKSSVQSRSNANGDGYFKLTFNNDEDRVVLQDADGMPLDVGFYLKRLSNKHLLVRPEFHPQDFYNGDFDEIYMEPEGKELYAKCEELNRTRLLDVKTGKSYLWNVYNQWSSPIYGEYIAQCYEMSPTKYLILTDLEILIMDYSNPDRIKIIPVKAEGEEVDISKVEFDQLGNVAYWSDSMNIWRIRTADGKYYQVDENRDRWQEMFVLNDSFFLFNPEKSQLFNIGIHDGTSELTYELMDFPFINSGDVKIEDLVMFNPIRQSVVFRCKSPSIGTQYYEFSGNNNEMYPVVLPNDFSVYFTHDKIKGKGWFGIGQEKIQYLNFEDNQFNEYPLTDVQVIEHSIDNINGVVYFSGFSLTNGGKVIGSVNYKGEIDFKALDNQDSITTLIPVN